MKRRAFQRQALSVSLFPFLAVLICTMGVIIVMLVIVVRQAAAARAAMEQQPAVQPEPAGISIAEAEEEHKHTLQDINWEREVMAKQRDERVAELAKVRQQLAHVEDHLRRLQKEAKDLLQTAQDIDQGIELDSSQLQAARDELARKQAEIAAAQDAVKKLKEQSTGKARWYALIPYDGPNGTRRRPVYIECTEAGVILQPEGLVLLPDDFNGPLGPGNPLDAALKAKREYLERNGERGLPYPLLIVRPDGIVAYMVARSALKSWEEEFGYELVDNEKRLAFGEPDPALAQQLAQTVRQARQRQAMMVASMPRKYQGDDTLNSFSTAEATSSMPEMQMSGRGVPGSNGPAGGGVGSGGTGMGGIGSGTGANFASTPGQAGTGSNSPTGTAGGYPGNTLRTASTGGNNNTPGGSAGSGGAPGGASAGSGGGGGGQMSSGANIAGANAAGGNAAGANAGNNSLGATSSAAGGGGASSGSSQWNNVAQGSASGASGSSSATAGSSAAAGQQSGKPGKQGKASSQGQGTSTLKRGQNWGLLDSQGRTVSVSRPIRVACQPNQIVVLPDIGDTASPIVIPLRDQQLSDQEVIAFVEAVKKQIGNWGIAAENGFWRPQLSIDVPANAEARFQQWEQALHGSGYEIKRKQR